MQTIVLPETLNKEIRIEELKGHEYVAYRSKTAPHNKVIYCVLVKFKRENIKHAAYSRENYNPEPELGTRFGFAPLSMDAPARFVAASWSEAIRLAAKDRDVKVFQSQAELIEAMHKQLF